ncbi:MAG: M23 family metallopeptidase [Prevotellaceae bacterium]|jgi:hypothetical protein|nr:M23 family metallopeptidase [Prevotellaceae bacterium]
MKRNSLILLFTVCLNAYSQYADPVKIPLLLSSGFGELRNNHFHSGIDIKTQGTVNIPIYTVEEGYVSRINVSPIGYGLALYVAHPDGRTSVYAHLNSFSPRIDQYVKGRQYEQETYRIELYPDSTELPVKRGEQIALSGNTGSSGGPHLHFELRDTETQAPIDPLPFYKEKIKDSRPPEIRAIAVYPFRGSGAVNNGFIPVRMAVRTGKDGKYLPPSQRVEAWGTITFGLKAYDRMSDVGHIYGVKTIRLNVDGNEIFRFDMGSFLLSETRMLNSFIDFSEWRRHRSMFMKLYRDPGNKLPFFITENDGYFTIDEERDYPVLYELEDEYGNRSSFSFVVTGKKQAIGEKNACANRMYWGGDNDYTHNGFSIVIPQGNLYANICFELSETKSTGYYSDRYRVNNSLIPLHDAAEISIKIHTDVLEDKNRYGIVKIGAQYDTWIGGRYENGVIKARIRELGDEYAVGADSRAPVITAVSPENWARNGVIRIKLTDDKSGIESFKGTVDGDFVLFVHDTKSTVYSYKIDPTHTAKGKRHELKFTAVDACGNKSELVRSFTY